MGCNWKYGTAYASICQASEGAGPGGLTTGNAADILVEPPLLVVEILSPDDSYWDLQERCQDYLTMGVETVWIIDPKTRSGRMCSGAEWVGAERLEVAGTPIFVELTPLFARLDVGKKD